ncbi:SUMO ligase siz1 [Ceratobasidium sp. 414]|nr:SUMO ligase siz1 [Ceratobasidium sp. 414]
MCSPTVFRSRELVFAKQFDHKPEVPGRYVKNILKRTPDTVDKVLIEPDGKWHTEDGKYGSAGWATSSPGIPHPTNQQLKAKLAANTHNLSDASGYRTTRYIIVDSDDSDVESLDSPGSPGHPRTRQLRFPGSVIDLTLSSDDECSGPQSLPQSTRPDPKDKENELLELFHQLTHEAAEGDAGGCVSQ